MSSLWSSNNCGTRWISRDTRLQITRGVMAGIALLAFCVPAWSQAVRIDSVGTIDRRTPVAVPDFGAAPGLETVAKEMSDVITYDLLFTGLFQTLPHENFPRSFAGFTADASKINFKDWKTTKADYLVYAYVTAEGEAIVVECRMFDIVTGFQVVGQRLTAARNLPRLIAHRFSEEIVRHVDGIPGIASSRICLSGGDGKTKEIYLADYDGANLRQVTKHGSISIKPKFSPDGTRIAYLSYKDRYPFLYILELATGKSTPLSKRVGLNAAPAWAPDAKALAFVLSKDGNTEIYLKNADGTGERRLTNNRAGDTSPTFAPSGRQIAFVSDRGGRAQIYVMNADGSNVRRVSYQGGSAYDPAWSPDGRRIACVAEKSGEGLEIYVMDVTGQNPLRLTNTAGGNESPSWSPDSRHVVFMSTRSGRAEIWAVNIEPPHQQHRITRSGMRCEGSSWGPRR